MFDPTVRSPHLTALYQLWSEKCGSRSMPARADFDPVEMAALLPHLYLVDVLRDDATAARRFRYRLIGTSIVNLLGRDSTGKWVDEALHGETTSGLRRIFTLLSETRAPVAAKGYIFYIREKNWIFVEALLLPLSAGGGEVDMILAGMVQAAAPAERGSGGDAERGAVEVFAAPTMRAYADPIIAGRRHSEALRG